MIKEETVLLKVRLFRADVVERRYYSTALVVYSLCFIFSFDVIHSNPGWVRGFINSVVSEVLLTRLSPGFVNTGCLRVEFSKLLTKCYGHLVIVSKR